jgi:hypothetical protein
MGLFKHTTGRGVLAIHQQRKQRLTTPFDPRFTNLPRSLTINSITQAPTLFYVAADAGGTTWAEDAGQAAGLLTESGSGTSPTYGNLSHILGDRRHAVQYQSGKPHTPAGTAFGDVTTGDMVVLVVVRYNTATDFSGLCGKRDGAGTFPGWGVRRPTTNVIQLIIDTGGADCSVDTATLTNSTWYAAMCFVDRSASAQWYVNGAASGAAVDVSSCAATITNSKKFMIGNVGDSRDAVDQTIALAALWTRAAWLDTHLQATVAAQTWAALGGQRWKS